MFPGARFKPWFIALIALASVQWVISCVLFIVFGSGTLGLVVVWLAGLAAVIGTAVGGIGLLGLIFCRIADDIWLLARRERENYEQAIRELHRQAPPPPPPGADQKRSGLR